MHCTYWHAKVSCWLQKRTLHIVRVRKIHALEAELDFHRGIYNLQVQYTQALFQGIKQAYHNFQENVVAVVCSPLKEVLSSYADLKHDASEASLRNFLTIFKNNAEHIQDAVDTLTPSTAQQHEGEEAFSKLGKEFFISLDSSLKTCKEERDRSIFEIEKLRQELNQALDTIKTLKMEKKSTREVFPMTSLQDQRVKVRMERRQLLLITDGKLQISHPNFFPLEEKTLSRPLLKRERYRRGNLNKLKAQVQFIVEAKASKEAKVLRCDLLGRFNKVI
ncbi:unnamed protein product [Ranitomeya imitator]|uniref:Uncharacterized protein n=1 Tax=Ranitomeya imitator TaxID=111125 RepID=A0ABN9LGW0_9NEOB|nr:unnamed protein product [Ranitomeya imitator]